MKIDNYTGIRAVDYDGISPFQRYRVDLLRTFLHDLAADLGRRPVILEIGCGNGVVSRLVLDDADAVWVGYDIVPDLIERANKLNVVVGADGKPKNVFVHDAAFPGGLQAAALRANVVAKSGDDWLPPGPFQFDAVIVFEVLEHLNSKEELYLMEGLRCYGCPVLITAPYRSLRRDTQYHPEYNHIRNLCLADMEHLAEQYRYSLSEVGLLKPPHHHHMFAHLQPYGTTLVERVSRMKHIQELLKCAKDSGNLVPARALLEDFLVAEGPDAALFDQLADLYEADGKTTLCWSACLDAQRLGPTTSRQERVQASAKAAGMSSKVRPSFSVPKQASLSQIRQAKTSILITTYRRIWSLERCLNSIIANTPSRNVEILIVIDNNDIETSDWCSQYDFGQFAHRIHLNKTKLEWVGGVNCGVSLAAHDYIVFLNDDMEVGKGWLMRALLLHSMYFSDQCGLLAFRDDFVNGRICCAGMVHRRFVREYLGGKMLNGEYTHYCADDELTEVAAGLGRYRYSDSCYAPHHHRSTKTGKIDEVVEGSLKVRDRDIAILAKRRQFNYGRDDLAQLPANGPELAAALEQIGLERIQAGNLRAELRRVLSGRTVAVVGAGMDYVKLRELIGACAARTVLYDRDPENCLAARQGLPVRPQDELAGQAYDLVFVPSLHYGRQIADNLRKLGVASQLLIEECMLPGALADSKKAAQLVEAAGALDREAAQRRVPAIRRQSRLASLASPRLGWARTFTCREDDLASEPQKHIDQAIAETCRQVREAGGRVTTWRGDFSTVNPSGEKTKRWENSWVLGNIELGPGMRVLDLGGASSQFSFYLASRQCEVEIVDIDYLGVGVIENARRVAETMDWKMRVLNWNAADGLPFEDGTFDAVFCICVLEHLMPLARRAVSRELARVLAPGGFAGLTVDYLARRKGPEGRGLRFSCWDEIQRDILVPSRLTGPLEPPEDDAPEEYAVAGIMLRKDLHGLPAIDGDGHV